jgi:hypothetical protein
MVIKVASGKVDVTVTSWDTLRFNWTESSQSVANNTTTVAWSLQLIAGSYGRISSSTQKDWTVTFGGTEYSGKASCGISNNSTLTLASGSTTVTHDADGTKNASFAFSFNFSGITFSGSALGKVSGSGTASLTTIPRASSISVPSFTMGAAGTITISRASSSFTHTLTYKFGSASGNIVTKTDGTSVSWTPDTETLAKQIPNATSGTGTITCTTYSGSTEIGTSTATFKATVPSDVVPSVTSITTSEATSGLAKQFGAYVKNKSALNVTVKAKGIYGSTIKSYYTKILGTGYDGASFKSNVLTSSGTVTIKTTVTDSRGRTATETATVEVLSYANPAISAFSVSRCDKDGNAADAGDYALVEYTYRVYKVGSKNKCAVTLEYKRNSKSTWETLWTDDTYSATVSKVTEEKISADYSWDFRLTVADYFTDATYTLTVSSAKVILDFKADGTGLGVGQTAQKSDTMQVAWAAEFNGAVWGTVMGLGQLPAIAEGSDLNDFVTPGAYAVRSASTAGTLSNYPSALGGVVFVQNSLGRSATSTSGTYLRQIVMPNNSNTIFCYARNLSQTEENGAWTVGDWHSVRFS